MSTRTHAKETNGTATHGITPDGAPQAGGMSGVAATPGEGALAREAVMAEALLRIGYGMNNGVADEIARAALAEAGESHRAGGNTAAASGERTTVSGNDGDAASGQHPFSAPASATAAPAPSSPRAPEENVVMGKTSPVAPDGQPASPADGGLASPAHNDTPRAPERDEDENLLTRVLIHEAETEDTATLLNNYDSATAHYNDLVEYYCDSQAEAVLEIGAIVTSTRQALLAALRRAAPGAAPEPEARYSGDSVGEEPLGGVCDPTPAPTGERAGGEADAEAVAEAVTALRRALRASVMPATSDETPPLRDALIGQHSDSTFWTRWEGNKAALVRLLDALDAAQRPAPVAAPRGTEGRDDAK